jgi:hypothetical protein
MLGGGVGFNILPEYVYELPEIAFNPPIGRVETNDCDYIVTDNREGNEYWMPFTSLGNLSITTQLVFDRKARLYAVLVVQRVDQKI